MVAESTTAGHRAERHRDADLQATSMDEACGGLARRSDSDPLQRRLLRVNLRQLYKVGTSRSRALSGGLG